MQISKSFLLGCTAVLCLLPQSLRAADTDAQVKAREALRNKMNELQGQPGNRETTAPAATAPTQPVAPAPAPQKKNAPPVAAKKPKHPKRMTTTEAAKHLFHPQVVQHVKKHIKPKPVHKKKRTS